MKSGSDGAPSNDDRAAAEREHVSASGTVDAAAEHQGASSDVSTSPPAQPNPTLTEVDATVAGPPAGAPPPYEAELPTDGGPVQSTTPNDVAADAGLQRDASTRSAPLIHISSFHAPSPACHAAEAAASEKEEKDGTAAGDWNDVDEVRRLPPSLTSTADLQGSTASLRRRSVGFEVPLNNQLDVPGFSKGNRILSGWLHQRCL